MNKISIILFTGMAMLASVSANAAFISEPCATTDVTANGNNAFACAGSISGNDTAGDMNSIFGEPDTVVWTEAGKFDIDTPSEGHDMTATAGTSGTWEYTGSMTLNPFIVVLKASSEYSAYLFKGFDLETNDVGTYLISFLNNGSQTPNLSHITIYATNDPGTGIFGNPVPLPAALWLFGPALLGFLGFRKKIK